MARPIVLCCSLLLLFVHSLYCTVPIIKLHSNIGALYDDEAIEESLAEGWQLLMPEDVETMTESDLTANLIRFRVLLSSNFLEQMVLNLTTEIMGTKYYRREVEYFTDDANGVVIFNYLHFFKKVQAFLRRFPSLAFDNQIAQIITAKGWHLSEAMRRIYRELYFESLIKPLKEWCIGQMVSFNSHLYPNMCPPFWDGIFCWPATFRGQIAVQPCPRYYEGFNVNENATIHCPNAVYPRYSQKGNYLACKAPASEVYNPFIWDNPSSRMQRLVSTATLLNSGSTTVPFRDFEYYLYWQFQCKVVPKRWMYRVCDLFD